MSDVVEKGKGKGRPKLVVKPHTLDKSKLKSGDFGTYISLYYDNDDKPLPLSAITQRITEADRTINKNIAQTALDIYFVRMNWKTTYSREIEEQFDTWLKNSIQLSRAYSLDLLKCVRELVAHKSGVNKIGDVKKFDDAILATVQNVFNKYNISVLREVIHAPKDMKKEYIGQLLDGKDIDAKELKEKKKTTKPIVKKPSFLIDHKYLIDLKTVLSLDDLYSADEKLAEKVEEAIEQAIRKYQKGKVSTVVDK